MCAAVVGASTDWSDHSRGHTTDVGLVRQRTAASLRAAMRLARRPPIPHVRREVLKAIRRLSLTDEGAEFLVECFSDLAMLESIAGELE